MDARVRQIWLGVVLQTGTLVMTDGVLANETPPQTPKDQPSESSDTPAVKAVSPPADSHDDVAKKAQNPVSDLVSVPFQWNLNGYIDESGSFQNLLNIQPVFPIPLDARWNLIQRIILPIYSTRQPRAEFGLGDTTASFFLSPSSAGAFTWGVGPVLLLPTATRSSFGAGQLGAGPTGVLVLSWQKWVVGFLINHVWSFAGEPNAVEVNQTLSQPFLNLNFSNGFYLNTSPILLTQWNRSPGNRWLVPVGLGIGKFFSTGQQRWNGQLAAYWNILRPDEAPHWNLRFTLTLLFPVPKSSPSMG